MNIFHLIIPTLLLLSLKISFSFELQMMNIRSKLASIFNRRIQRSDKLLKEGIAKFYDQVNINVFRF